MTEAPPPIDPGTNPYPDAFTPAAPAAGTAVARISKAEIESLLAPYTVDMRTWLRGIMTSDDFPDQDPEAVMAGMLAQILLAETPDAALAGLDLLKAKEMCGGEPGGRSGVLEITGVRPMKSTYADGTACYVIVQAVQLADGQKIQFSTGAKAVQTVLWKMAFEGWLPFRAALEIRREKTQAGYHPLNLVAGI